MNGRIKIQLNWNPLKSYIIIKLSKLVFLKKTFVYFDSGVSNKQYINLGVQINLANVPVLWRFVVEIVKKPQIIANSIL